MMLLEEVEIALVRTDGGTQARRGMNPDVVKDYEEVYRETPEKMPSVEVVRDESGSLWLTDGFHRLEAAKLAGLETLKAGVNQGTLEDAKWRAAAVNKYHGLRRTNADKRLAVEMALENPKSREMSDRAIAKHCGVGNKFVGDVRKQLCPDHSCDGQPTKRIGLDGRARRLPRPKSPKTSSTIEVEATRVTATEKPECEIPERTVLYDSRDDADPIPWVSGDLLPIPDFPPKGDDPQQRGVINGWLDKATDKLLLTDAASEDDIRVLRHCRDVATISAAANAETVDRARQIIETNRETMLANEAFVSIDVFNDSARLVARVPQFRDESIKHALDLLAERFSSVFQAWMDEKMAEHREKQPPKRRGTKN